MRRRDLLALIGGATILWPLAADAQQKAIPLIVMLFPAEPLPGTMDAFLRGLRQAGYERGREFDLIIRSTENDPARRPVVAKEVVGLSPSVIVSGDTPLTVELRHASDTIPIVGVALTNPVDLGLAASLARPGRNVTGVLAAASAPSKLVELLLETVPGVVKIGVLFNPNNAGNIRGIDSLKADTAAQPITLVLAGVAAPTAIEAAFQRFAGDGVGALLVSQDGVFTAERQKIAKLALAARLPSISGFRVHTEAGSLMSYGSSFPQRYLVAGEYAAKILKGGTPGDLPIQLQPKLELVINLRTAKALGLDIPRSILARADEVIE